MLSVENSNNKKNVDVSMIVDDYNGKDVIQFTPTAQEDIIKQLSSSQESIGTVIIEEQQEELINQEEDENNIQISRHKMSTSTISIIQNYNREIICLLALILTTYAAIQNRYSNKSNNIYQLTNPIPIFGNYYETNNNNNVNNNQISYVQEWPQGFLTTVQTRVTLSDISIILFYAPWCANSHFIKKSYEQLAKLYYKKIYFAAVNCWQPNGDCRLQHNKVKIWPILVVYLPKNLAIQYNGPLYFKPLYKFINSILNPIKRLHNINELNQLKLYNNIIIVGFFQNINNWYQNYYRTALKWHEHDPFQDLVKFAGVTGESANDFGISTNNNNSSCIRIYYSYNNDTIEDCRLKWKIEDIIYWIKYNIENKPKLWCNLNQYDRNNSLISINNNPTLLYFIKRDYINNDNNNYNKLISHNIMKLNLLYNDNLNITITNNNQLNYLNYNNNRKLSFIMLDISIFYKFVNKLGIKLHNTQYSVNNNNKVLNTNSNSAAVVIIDKENESIYHLNKSLNYDNIKNFIIDFQINHNLTRNLRNNKNSVNTKKELNEIYIPEIDQLKFHNIINNNNNNETITNIILITTKSCSLCNLLMLNLLKLSRILNDFNNIKFYKIDGNINDILWQYTMGYYPTLLILHSNNNNLNIRIFPNNLIPNDKNLFGFLLSNIYNNNDKLKILLKYCQKRLYGFTNCIKLTKIYILNIIGDNLTILRNYMVNNDNEISKDDIIRKLSNLNELYFMILNAKNSNGLVNIDFYINKLS